MLASLLSCVLIIIT